MDFQRQPLHSVLSSAATSVSGAIDSVSSRLDGAASATDQIVTRLAATLEKKHYTIRQWRRLDPVSVWNPLTDSYDTSYAPGSGGHLATGILSDGVSTSLEGHLRELRNARGPYADLDRMLADIAGSDLTASFMTAASGQLFAHHGTQIANKQLDARDPIVGPATNRIVDNAIQSADNTSAKWVTMSFPLAPRAVAARMIVYESGTPTSLVGVSKLQFFNGSERVYPINVQATSTAAPTTTYPASNLLLDTYQVGATEGGWFSGVAPSSAAPQILLFTFADLTEITHVRLLHTDSVTQRQPKHYEFQFTSSPEVTIYDSVTAESWVTVDGVNGLPYGYLPSPSGSSAGYVTLVPAMLDNTTPGGSAFASSVYSASYDAFKAFNRNTADYWHSALSQSSWVIGYDFGAITPISRYAIQGYAANTTYNAKTWALEGTTDMVVWKVIDTRSNVDLGGVRNEFVLPTQVSYRAYRLNITANNGAAAVVVPELELIDFAPSTLAPDSLSGDATYAGNALYKAVDVPAVARPNLKRSPVVAFKFWWQDATSSDNVFNPGIRLFLRVNDGTPVEWTGRFFTANLPEFARGWFFVDVPWADVTLGGRNKIAFYATDPATGYREYLNVLNTRVDIPVSDSPYVIEYAMPTDGDSMVPAVASAASLSKLAPGQLLKRASGLILGDNFTFLGKVDLHPQWDGLFSGLTVTTDNQLRLAEVRPGSYQKEGTFETDPFTVTSALRRSFTRLVTTAASGAGLEVWYRGGSSSSATLSAAWQKADAAAMTFPRTDLAWIQLRLVFQAQKPVERANIKSVSGSANLKQGTFNDLELYLDNQLLKVFERGRLPNADLYMNQQARNLTNWSVTLNTAVTGSASAWSPASGSAKAVLSIRQGDSASSGTSTLKSQPFLYEDALWIYLKGQSYSRMSPGRGEVRLRKASDGSLLHTQLLPDLNPNLKTPSPGASGMAAGDPVVVDVPALYGQMVYFEIAAVTSLT